MAAEVTGGQITSYGVGTSGTRILGRAPYARTVVLVPNAATPVIYVAGDSGVTTSNGFALSTTAPTTFVIPAEDELWAVAASAASLGVATWW